MAFLSHLRPNNKSKKPITERKTSRGTYVIIATPRVAIITASVATAANAPTIALRQFTVIPATRTSVKASTNSTAEARNAAITIAHCISFFSFSVDIFSDPGAESGDVLGKGGPGVLPWRGLGNPVRGTGNWG